MTSIFSLNEVRQNSVSEKQILCFYSNVTHNIQILRLASNEGSPWERVIFPGERLLFNSQPQVKLEIQTSETGTVLISCQQLRVMKE